MFLGHLFLTALSTVLGVLAYAAVAYFFFVLVRRHRTTWAKVAFWTAIGLFGVSGLSGMINLLFNALNFLPSGSPVVFTDTWLMVWTASSWVELALKAALGFSFFGLSLQARRDRQVAESAITG